jgi:hypothetical protein
MPKNRLLKASRLGELSAMKLTLRAWYDGQLIHHIQH